jgi:hypothetical protein
VLGHAGLGDILPIDISHSTKILRESILLPIRELLAQWISHASFGGPHYDEENENFNSRNDPR